MFACRFIPTTLSACLFPLLLVGVAPADERPPLLFEAEELSTELTVGYAVRAVDVNNSGRLDIAVVDSKRVLWLENPGWQEHVVHETPEARTDNVSFAVADVDGDGRIDFGLGFDWQPNNTQSGGKIGWLRQTESGPWEYRPLGEEPTVHRMHFVQLQNRMRPTLTVLPLKGRGTSPPDFDESPVRMLAFDAPENPLEQPWDKRVLDQSLHVTHNYLPVDFDGDGLLDFLMVSFEGVFLLRQTEPDQWEPVQLGRGDQESRPNRGASEIGLGQLADGRRYIATIEPWHGDKVVVYLPPESGEELGGELWQRFVLDDQLAWGHAVSCADLTGDGNDDLVIGVRDDQEAGHRRGVRIYSPTSAAPDQWPRTLVDPGGVAVEDLVVADLDEDGRPDIVAVGRQTKNIRIYWNRTSNGASEGEDWAQWRGPQRDGVWRETGLRETLDEEELTLRWRVPIASGYSGPTVANGRVYVTDRVAEPEEIERVHCFDWQTGRSLWSLEYPASYEGISYTAGPRASVLVDEGRAYSLGAAGHLHCLAADSGEVLWKKDLRSEYRIRMPNWGIAASPLVEDDLLILQIGGEEEACLVALDKRTGEPRWQALEDDASYSAPIVIEQGGQRVLVCWTGERIVGLVPGSGELLWDFPFKWEQWPIGIATPVVHGDRLLVSEAHKGSLLLRTLDDPLGVEKLWHRRSNGEPALHSLISTPMILDDHIYGADNEGILRCLELETGKQLWEDDSAVEVQRWATIHMVRQEDRVWMFNDQGELIIARLSPEGFEEISRAKLIEPTTDQLRRRGGVTWAHPAFAYRHVFARNDKELVCADLSDP